MRMTSLKADMHVPKTECQRQKLQGKEQRKQKCCTRSLHASLRQNSYHKIRRKQKQWKDGNKHVIYMRKT